MENNNTNNMEPIVEEKLNPWFSIWLQPRRTMRQILDSGNHGPVLELAAIAGIADALNRAGDRNLSPDSSLFGIILLALIGGAIGGTISLYIWAALVKWTGKWLGGQGTYDDIAAACAWSGIPAIWSLIPWTLAIIAFGKNLFIPGILLGAGSFTAYGIAAFFHISIFVLGLWGAFINIKCVAEAHGFSSWMSLLNFILAFLVIFIPILILVFIFAGPRF